MVQIPHYIQDTKSLVVVLIGGKQISDKVIVKVLCSDEALEKMVGIRMEPGPRHVVQRGIQRKGALLFHVYSNVGIICLLVAVPCPWRFTHTGIAPRHNFHEKSLSFSEVSFRHANFCRLKVVCGRGRCCCSPCSSRKA